MESPRLLPQEGPEGAGGRGQETEGGLSSAPRMALQLFQPQTSIQKVLVSAGGALTRAPLR